MHNSSPPDVPSESSKETGHPVLLYDGVCGLCNGVVQFVLPRDPGNLFYFASLQSEYARSVLLRHKQDPDNLNTVYVVVDSNTREEHLLSKSSAAIYVASKLGAPLSLAPVFKILPLFIRDGLYDFVAANRYKWFGKHDVCLAPTPKDRERFLG